MRNVTLSILVVAFGASACGGPAPVAGDGQTLATPAAAATGLAGEPANSVAAPAATGAPARTKRDQPAPVSSPLQPRPAAPREIWRELTIPAGTSLPVVLDTAVGSDTSRVEAPVTGHLSRAIMVDGVTALPEGSVLTGVVTDATRSAKVKGRASIGLSFDTVTVDGEDGGYPIDASPVERRAAATKKEDSVKILAPAVGGAIIGRIAGGRKGALIGAGAGAGAGSAVVMGTRGKEVRLARGSALTLRLTEPLTIRIRS